MTSSVWTDWYFGPNGDPNNNFDVPSGAFCSTPSSSCQGVWTLSPQLGGPSLQRSFGVGASSLPTSANIASINTVTTYDSNPFDDTCNPATSFRDALEGWGGGIYGTGHNNIHVWIGGSMSPLSSPNDPVFFFHHSFIDRLFYRWQVAQDCYASCYHPQLGEVTSSTPGAQLINGMWRLMGHELLTDMYPWQVMPANVVNSTNSLNGYTYGPSLSGV